MSPAGAEVMATMAKANYVPNAPLFYLQGGWAPKKVGWFQRRMVGMVTRSIRKTLREKGNRCAQMQGLSLRNVAVKLVNAKGKVLYKDFGELLFTHFGISGPTVLSASAHMKGPDNCLVIDLKPALDEGKLNERILRDLDTYKNRTMENALTDLLPRSMIPVVLRRLEIPPQMQANSLKKQQRRSLVELLKAFPVEITGKRPVTEAIITSGGIKVSEIDPKTMESRKVSGLYFAGEVIDCDAYTGGFNLQIAWATAFAAGSAAKNSR
jgi:predicted Rossmann fold flavoprotein